MNFRSPIVPGLQFAYHSFRINIVVIDPVSCRHFFFHCFLYRSTFIPVSLVLLTIYYMHPPPSCPKMWKSMIFIQKSLLQLCRLCVFLNFRYSSQYFTQIYKAQYGAAMLVYLCDTPTWRPQNSVTMFNLLWLSRRLIICTEETGI